MSPIPGMSLTTEPKSRPWESPPQMSKVSEVIDFYAEKLSEPRLMHSALTLVKKGVPIYDITMGLIKTGIMDGRHTLDAGTLASPVITEMIKSMAELNDIGYSLTQEDIDSSLEIDENVAADTIKNFKETIKEVKEEEDKATGLMARGKKDE